MRDQRLQQGAAKKQEAIDLKALSPQVDASQIAGKCRDISTIEVDGVTQLLKAQLDGITQPFVGRCLGVPEVEQILGEITRAYMLRGFVTTRAYLPAQDLGQGKLKVLVVEGRVEKIRVDAPGRTGFRPSNTIPAVKGDLLNLRDLEQGIDQINRLQSNGASFDIAPGSAPGLSEVIVRNTPAKFYRWNLSADNQGSASTGKNQLGVSFSSDSALGFSEFIMATHRESLPLNDKGARSTSDSLMLAVPYGYNTFTYNGSISSYRSTLHAPSGLALLSDGDSSNNSLAWDRLVYRNQSTRLNLTGTFTVKDSNNYLEGQFLSVSSRKLSVLDLDSSLSTGWGPGVLGLSLGWSQGLKAAGALHDIAGLPDFAPRAQFRKIKYGASYFLPFRVAGRDWTFNSSLTGQQAKTTLFGSEQISIGSIYSVRGFVKGSLAGDSGYYLRNDLSTRSVFAPAGQVFPVRWYAGLDMGSVRNRAAGVPQGALVGAALGASVNWQGASWDLSTTCPLATPQGMAKEGCQTWFRLGYTL
ncbi:MAG: ShlB/FhaC/HecB family hemolysin secretion/activation protein [Brachymonas sp.]